MSRINKLARDFLHWHLLSLACPPYKPRDIAFISSVLARAKMAGIVYKVYWPENLPPLSQQVGGKTKLSYHVRFRTLFSVGRLRIQFLISDWLIWRLCVFPLARLVGSDLPYASRLKRVVLLIVSYEYMFSLTRRFWKLILYMLSCVPSYALIKEVTRKWALIASFDSHMRMMQLFFQFRHSKDSLTSQRSLLALERKSFFMWRKPNG